MSVTISNISKTFGDFRALKDVSFETGTGELVALLGPSGSGKTTLLRVIAGLEFPDEQSGDIKFNGESVANLNAHKRGAGFVFQSYALFPNMTVFNNIAFGLRSLPRGSRPRRKERREIVSDLLSKVQLEGYEKRFPSQLSGGQRQRIALARALAVKPRVLLLDEPFGALDAKVRKELRKWLRHFHDQTRLTTLFVTHDQEEAFELADRVVLFNDGVVEQIGTPDEIYRNPESRFAAGFVGTMNRLPATSGDGSAVSGSIRAPLVANEVPGREGELFVRPHDIEVSTQPASGDRWIPATLTHAQQYGAVVRCTIDGPGIACSLEVEIPRNEFDQIRPSLNGSSKVFVRVREARFFAL